MQAYTISQTAPVVGIAPCHLCLLLSLPKSPAVSIQATCKGLAWRGAHCSMQGKGRARGQPTFSSFAAASGSAEAETAAFVLPLAPLSALPAPAACPFAGASLALSSAMILASSCSNWVRSVSHRRMVSSTLVPAPVTCRAQSHRRQRLLTAGAPRALASNLPRCQGFWYCARGEIVVVARGSHLLLHVQNLAVLWDALYEVGSQVSQEGGFACPIPADEPISSAERQGDRGVLQACTA